MITYQERNSLRFYQGDIQNYENYDKIKSNYYTSEFYKTPEAYQLLNMLLYLGTNNEYARIYEEGRRIPVNLLYYPEELLKVYKDIFKIMWEYSKNPEEQRKKYCVFRKDRIQAKEMVEAGYTFGFTSCTLCDRESFMRKKSGIMLLELEVNGSIPHVILNKVLGENKYQEQEEFLLPPFIEFTSSELPFTEKEQNYRDRNNEPPKAKYKLVAKGLSPKRTFVSQEEIFQKNKVERVVAVLKKLEKKEEVSDAEMEDYSFWKTCFQQLINYQLWITGEMI